MFTKGSRYRNLSEAVFLTAKGERIRGKALRLFTAPESTVLHTVKAGDRLDLLAYKYYGDTTKWWQICDANPDWHFPVDLLDLTPHVTEDFVLTHADFAVRYDQLIVALRNIGTVLNDRARYFVSDGAVADVVLEPSFLESKVLVKYAPAQRAAVLTAIRDHDFHNLGSFSFAEAADLVEIFRLDDPVVKRNWDLLVANLAQLPGVIEVQSFVDEGKLALVYNIDMVTKKTLLDLMSGQGFIAQVAPSARVGRKINIPPNQLA